MNDEQLARFEANIERLVERTFANFFGKKVRAADIALQLARALETYAQPSQDGDTRAFAPDYYVISLNPLIHTHLVESQPNITNILSQHLIMLATQAGYRLRNAPIVEFITDRAIDRGHLRVHAEHTDRPENSTAAMQQVEIPTGHDRRELVAYLLVNDARTVPLAGDFINIGRARDNEIVIDDAHVSRYHLQIRRRFGIYILFDVRSQGSTTVNDVVVKEHQLQPGDVIRIGHTQLVYMEEADDDLDDDVPIQTDTHDPV